MMSIDLSLSPNVASTFASKLAQLSLGGRSVVTSRATEEIAPVHVLYGGAHLFQRGTPAKLAARALETMDGYGVNNPQAFASLFGVDRDLSGLASTLAARVRAKISGPRAIEAMCIDFEDGFGVRTNEEEDEEATRAATELAALTLAATSPPPEGSLLRPRVGIRIKSLAPATIGRAVRTLDLFLTKLVRELGGAPMPAGFSVTLPKVEHPEEVAALTSILEQLEGALKLEAPTPIELMIESPRALVDDRGALATGKLVEAAKGRATSLHLGAYDLTAALGVTAGDQRLDHPFCDLARMLLRLATSQFEAIEIVDGATTILPIAAKDATVDEATRAIHRAWKLHASNVTRAIDVGIWRGWDLHPAQLPARYGALFVYFLTREDALAKRLRNFVVEQVRASRVGQAFDDAATGRGLLTFFRRGIAIGALDPAKVSEETSLSIDELTHGSLEDIAARTSAAASPATP